jgi:hypothetical protein
MVAHAAFVGKWRIVESGTWPRYHLDLCGPAFLRTDADGTGEMAFGALCASIASGSTPSGIDFEWNGADESDQVTGTGWADLREDGCLGIRQRRRYLLHRQTVAFFSGLLIASCSSATCSARRRFAMSRKSGASPSCNMKASGPPPSSTR